VVEGRPIRFGAGYPLPVIFWPKLTHAAVARSLCDSVSAVAIKPYLEINVLQFNVIKVQWVTMVTFSGLYSHTQKSPERSHLPYVPAATRKKQVVLLQTFYLRPGLPLSFLSLAYVRQGVYFGRTVRRGYRFSGFSYAESFDFRHNFRLT